MTRYYVDFQYPSEHGKVRGWHDTIAEARETADLVEASGGEVLDFGEEEDEGYYCPYCNGLGSRYPEDISGAVCSCRRGGGTVNDDESRW